MDAGPQRFDCLHDFDATSYFFVCLLPPALPGRQPPSSGEQQMTRTAFSQPARDLEANTPEAARYEITRVSSAREWYDAAARDERLKSQDVARASVDQSNAVFGLGSDDLGRNPGRRRSRLLGGIDVDKTTPALRVLLRNHSAEAPERCLHRSCRAAVG